MGEVERGFRRGLAEAGLVEGADYELVVRNAHGDAATLNSLVDAALTERTDLVVTFSTPTLQAALRKVTGRPIVFTFVADPIAAGAGTSFEDHPPNVRGISTGGPYEETLDAILACLPGARRIGTLFVPAEVDTVFHRDRMTAAAKARGLEFVVVAANTATEVPDAAIALTGRDLDAICRIPGNLTASSFPSLAEAARRQMSSLAEQGAAVTVARDYEDAGREAGLLAARVMRGKGPAGIPFAAVQTVRITVHRGVAREGGLTVPAPSSTARVLGD